MLKAFSVWRQWPEQPDNSGGTAKYQRHRPTTLPCPDQRCTLFVLTGSEYKGCGGMAQLSGDACLCALARAEEGGDDAVQGAQFLLGALGALKQVAQIAGHARALVGMAQKAT